MAAARWLNARQFSEHVKSLPPPDNYEDDPNYIRPVEEVGLHRATPEDNAVLENARQRASSFMDTPRGARLHRIPTDRIDAGQSDVQLEALHHYVQKGPATPEKYDQDGWFGTEHPVVAPHPSKPGRMVILDGTHRVAAAKLRGEDSVVAHVVPKSAQRPLPPEPDAATQTELARKGQFRTWRQGPEWAAAPTRKR